MIVAVEKLNGKLAGGGLKRRRMTLSVGAGNVLRFLLGRFVVCWRE